MLLSCTVVAGCRATSTPAGPVKIARYEVRAAPGIEHSLIEPAFRAALAAPEVKATPERFPLVRVGATTDKAPDQGSGSSSKATWKATP